jgi:hypothetical protein
MTVDHVKVTGSAGLGVRLSPAAAFTAASRELVVSGSGAVVGRPPYPLRIDGARGVGSIPSGSYSGNASDFIQVIASSALQNDTTFHDRGVPYQIGGSGSFGVLTVGAASLTTLTVEPGVEMRFFGSGGNFGGLFIGTVSTAGRILAAGTAARPIVFTAVGDSPPAGSWEGVTFDGPLAADNLLDHVQILAAGAHGGDQGYGCPPLPSQTDAALKIFSEPSAQFVFNSLIADSSYHGIFRAWVGSQVDFTPTNTFVNVARCNQVLPKPPVPQSCPDPAPCS